jgi:2-oxoglutarate ferredoxin oxidoreductase subunit alpha
LNKSDFVVRFAGEGGQGFMTAAIGLAAANTQSGYHAQTFATFPSQIQGGPTWMQVRISTDTVLSRGDELDVLVVFNEQAYLLHKDEVRDGGVIIYDSDGMDLGDGENSLGIPFEKLAKSTGNSRSANMVVMGALAGLIGIPQSILEEFIKRRWSNTARYGETIVPTNIHALTLGREAAAACGFEIGELDPPKKPSYEQIFLDGNQAVCLGAVASGVQFYCGYPISPATTILTWMEKNLVGDGKFAYQVSSEIEAITSVIGAGYAGTKAMSATAGPGFSLMSEGLGMAWMAEIPLVIVDVQRGGPATGLPTKTEQSDLLNAINPAHGDVSLPVIAPGTVEECFYGTVEAFNWAETYQGPVVLLSEHSLSEKQQNIPKPNLNKLKVQDRIVYKGKDEYQRYEPSGISPMPVPGGPGSYVANASEHDGIGDTTHLSERHIQMTERRFRKLESLIDNPYECDRIDSDVAIMPWGGSKGPAKEAYDQLLLDGKNVGWLYTMFLNPINRTLLDELRNKELVLVPELNYLGQFASVLRSQGVNAEPITQYTGLPFKVKDLVQRISSRLIQLENGRSVS